MGAALPESGLDKLADGLKKLISWLLCGAVTAFTLYLSVSGVLTGSADRAAVKAAQTAVSGAVPVVGSILAESAEMVLSAAHSLRAAIGAAGVLPRAARAAERAVFALPRGGLCLGGQRRQAA